MFDFSDLLWRLPALIAAITFHEYAHARAAYAMGDPTPRYYGRLTLNPFSHLDPVGFLMLLLFRFGWAKPVPFNPFNLHNRKLGMLIVPAAGPAANILLAFLTIVVQIIFPLRYGSIPFILLYQFRLYNLFLAAFNLLPVPPLDGSRILAAALPAGSDFVQALEQYGWLILIMLIFTGGIRMILIPLVTGLDSFLVVLARLITLQW